MMRLSQYRSRLRIRSRVRATLESAICATDFGYMSYLRTRYGTHVAKGCPWPAQKNRTLKCAAEIDQALQLVKELGLIPHPDPPKNWDALGAVGSILAETDSSAWVLDAGGELYSSVLPCLTLYGYRHLEAVNLSFGKLYKRGPINYRPGDLLHTSFPDETFSAISCLSVIEHGVDLSAYFREMSRLLKPGGILVTSTDYWSSPVHTFGLTAYGVPIRIFGPREIEEAIAEACETGLVPTGAVDLTCKERVVRWQGGRLAYTFLTFTLRKTPTSSGPSNQF
jgi:hypothetical protein